MASLVTNVSFFFFAAILIQIRGRSLEGKSHLEAAMRRGDIEKARALIRGGVLKYYPGPKDRESIYSKLRYLQILLENHIVRINKKDNDLKKPPREEGSFDVVLIPGTALVTRVVVNVTTLKLWGDKTMKDGRKPIHVICLLPDVSPSIVEIFLENGNDDVNTKTASSATPLMLAAISSNLEVVKFLVERGARVNDFASTMLERGEEINGHLAFAKIFSKTKLKPSTSQLHYSALISALIANNVDIIQYLLSKGADVNNKGQGWMTLFYAVNVNRTDFMEILLRNGLDVNSEDILGSTALHKAAELGNIETAKFLLKNGANLNATDFLGWTPLHVASFFSKFGGKEMIQFLVQSGSDIDRLTDGGYSPLNLVEAGFNPLFLPFLVKNIDSLNKTENYTDLPEEEPNERHTEIVDSVIQLGATLNHQDSMLGWSTLHWAAASGDLDVAKLLVKYGAVISSRDKWDRNPLENAGYFGRPKIVEFLKTARDLVL